MEQPDLSEAVWSRRMRLSDIAYDIHSNGKTIVLTSLVMLIVCVFVSVMVFFIVLGSAEKELVMVPNVVGKDLPEALLELQAKELYPRLQLRYSENSVEKGVILEQDPTPGAIVKGGKRVGLVVSQGTLIDTVQNYIGENIVDVQKKVESFVSSGTGKYVQIRLPYLVKYSDKPAGIILEQKPQAGAPISNNTELIFVVSKGSATQKVTVPDLRNATLDVIYKTMQHTALVFSFKEAAGNDTDTSIAVIEQKTEPSIELKAFSALNLSVSLPKTAENDIMSGILSTSLTEFPYPFTVSLNATYQNGAQKQLATFRHPGGACTIPYAVPEGTALSLHVVELNKEVYRYVVGQ